MPEDVRFYDFEFNFLHIEHDIISCNWTLYLNDVGSFEMHFPLSSDLVTVVMQNRYLVAVQGDKQAIITGIQLQEEGVIYGKTCNWILTRFCLPDRFNTDSLFESGVISAKDAQSVCGYLLEKGMGTISNFFAEADEAATFAEIYLENKTISSVFALVQNCLSQVRGGHTVFFDVNNRVWRFRLIWAETSLMVVSEENRNCCDTEYTEDLQNYFANGWYEQEIELLGNWNAAQNNPKLINGNKENFAKAYRVTEDGERFDISFSQGNYIVCKNKEGNWERCEDLARFPVQLESKFSGIYNWEAALSAATEQEAKKELLKDNAVLEEAQVKTYHLRFGKDYKLGDVLRFDIVKGNFRSSLLQQVSGVNLWYETEDVGEQPILVNWEEGYGLQS